MGNKGKEQVTRGTAASAARKNLGEREKFETFKGEKRVAAQVRKAPRKEKEKESRQGLGQDFPLGAVGLYTTLLGFVAFVAAALWWVVVISLPKEQQQQ